ncbi:MAG: DUF4198 domain-containing protein [Bacteroidetes bacterium]|nr:MAG: DUF4198 domain-containing protein [Bacteroidota bacterium]
MKKLAIAILAFVLFSSHDMYLKLNSYFLAPNTPARIMLLNGTFDASENTIDRNRMRDASLIGNGKRINIDSTQWHDEGQTTILNFTTGAAGTWVVGVSTRPRNIEMAAADFNEYLEHDGVIDELNWRRTHDMLDADAVEKYSKHVKAIFQVGEQTSDDWQTPLDYPIEFMPLRNPYELAVGDEMEVLLLLRGEPLGDQLVLIGSEKRAHHHGAGVDHDHAHGSDHSHQAADHSHDHVHAHTHEHDHAHASAEHEHTDEGDHHHHSDTQLRTDRNGKLKFPLTHEGIWYLRTIFMAQAFDEGLTHESNWATLTFELGHPHHHGANGHTHDEGHEHDHHHHADDGHGPAIPGYLYWIVSLVLVAGLFLWYNRNPTA